MRISRIQNYKNNYNQTFEAKFRKKDIKELINYTSFIDDEDKSAYPKLYTMLKHLDEQCPEDVAYLEYVTKTKDGKYFRPVKNDKERWEIVENNFEKPLGVRIYTRPQDYKDRYEKKDFIGHSLDQASPFEALKDATITNDDTHFGYIHIPENIFEQEWWKNKDKTAEDIKKLAIDA